MAITGTASPLNPAQQTNLDINLAPKTNNTEPISSSSNLDLNLDITLPQQSENNDWLQTEDQKNETLTDKEEMIQPVASGVEEVKPTNNTTENKTPQAGSLTEDMQIINELQQQASSGGGATQTATSTSFSQEPAKTFDLDTMLGNSDVIAPPVETPTTMPSVAPLGETPAASANILPAFTIPTAGSQTPTATVMQTNIPVHKTSGVKIMLFSMLFVALGFTTFFILKTMYPVEFDNLVGSQEAIHASADTINTGDIIDTSMTGTDTTETTGDDTIDEDLFGELNELETIPQETVPVQTDISRLTTYATQGNAFVVKGKELQNTTMIKYGLYISKKSTAFLEKIANGEEINNLSGYFAQFDQYSQKLDAMIAQPTQDTPTSSIQTYENQSPEAQNVLPSTTETGMISE